MLIARAGLPGTAKSVIAREVAIEASAAYLSVDQVFGLLETLELVDGDPLERRSYVLVRELAMRQLELGLSAVIDAVRSRNNAPITRCLKTPTCCSTRPKT